MLGKTRLKKKNLNLKMSKIAIGQTQKQNKKINMSVQSCNYCKEQGHRIHAMDEYGVYLADESGERIISCPVIIAKNLAKEKRMKKVEMEFPPLPGSTRESLSAWSGVTEKLTRGIAISLKEKKQKEWEDRKAEKEAKQRAWEERHVEKMTVKYGPLWHWQVKDTPEDIDTARDLRWDEEEVRRIQDEEDYYVQREREEQWKKEWEQEHKEKEERRAKMTPEERRQDEWDEEEEMDDELWGMSCDRERHQSCERQRQTIEKELYEMNGWPWPPKRF